MLSTLVLSTTDRCQIECPHCGAECSPRNRNRLSFDEMCYFINQVEALGFLDLVIFTGGEPFLLGKELLEAVRYCSDRGLKTRIVTNGFWALTADMARTMVQQCIDVGLTEINISCDEYHQQFIPIQRIRFANDACRDLGLPALLGYRYIKNAALTLERLEKAMGRTMALFDYSGVNPSNDVVLTGYDVPICNDMVAVSDSDILYPDSDTNWQQPCASVMKEVIITPKKRLSICCGMIPRRVQEISFGPLCDKSLEQLIVEADSDLVTNWLALEGPYGMMKFILHYKPETPFRPQYVSQCHLCSEILTRSDCRSVLEEHAHEKIPELSLKRRIYDHVIHQA